LLISNYFGRSFDEFGFHNWIVTSHAGEGLIPEPVWNLFTCREIATEKLAPLSLIIVIKQRKTAFR
jgi:hypothetical protein